MRPALTLLLAALAASTVLARDHRAVRPATPDGVAVSCIPLAQIDQSLVRNDRVIDFRMRGGRVYRNILLQDCPSLGFERRFAYATSLGMLCSSDIVTVFSTAPMSGASCGLGRFQPVRLGAR